MHRARRLVPESGRPSDSESGDFWLQGGDQPGWRMCGAASGDTPHASANDVFGRTPYSIIHPGFRSGGSTIALTAPRMSIAVGAGMKCIFSVDVEDWFHILDIGAAPAITEWAALPSLIETNFMRLLDLFSEARCTVTCFFLGWVAEQFPHLVEEAHRRGHEIASHGYSHRLVFEMTREEFLQDVAISKRIL